MALEIYWSLEIDLLVITEVWIVLVQSRFKAAGWSVKKEATILSKVVLPTVLPHLSKESEEWAPSFSSKGLESIFPTLLPALNFSHE